MTAKWRTLTAAGKAAIRRRGLATADVRSGACPIVFADAVRFAKYAPARFAEMCEAETARLNNARGPDIEDALVASKPLYDAIEFASSQSERDLIRARIDARARLCSWLNARPERAVEYGARVLGGDEDVLAE